MHWIRGGGLLLAVCGMTLLGACRSAPPREALVDPGFAFDALDRDQSGELSLDEFSRLPLDREETRRVFKQLDRDGNGRLTRDEFKPVGVVYRW